MEYFKILTVLLVIITHICGSWQKLVEFHIRLDTDCASYSPRMRALEVVQKLFRDLDPDGDLTDCCCLNKNITCYMQYSRSFESLLTFAHCVNHADAAKQGTYISNLAVAEVENDVKKECTVGIKNFTGSSGTNTNVTTNCNRGLSSVRPPGFGMFRPPGQGLLQGQGSIQPQDQGAQKPQGHYYSGHSGNPDYYLSHTTTQTYSELNEQTSSFETDSNGGTINKQVAEKQTQTADGGSNAKTIGGAVGGGLAALATLGPLAYYMYKKLKRNKVDNMNSTTDLFSIPPGFDFSEAPNSVAPAGTS